MPAVTALQYQRFPRDVRPEWLDSLPSQDPRARRSRADLRRINRIMGALGTLRGALDKVFVQGSAPTHLVELGAGDGTLMARLARQRASRWPGLKVSLLDLQPAITPATQKDIEHSGWPVAVVCADVFAWLDTAPMQKNEIIIANLFVHHFNDAQIKTLFAGIAARALAFVCCEPRRCKIALFGSHCLGVLGCNDVTRHDALASVHAGFRGRELSAQWPDPGIWTTHESNAGLFLQRFIARRRASA
jgi:hypothetical protein